MQTQLPYRDCLGWAPSSSLWLEAWRTCLEPALPIALEASRSAPSFFLPLHPILCTHYTSCSI